GGSGGNGVYHSTTATAFPNSTFSSTNCWVDVMFSTGDTTAPTVTTVNPANNATGVSRSAAITVTFSEAMDANTVNGSSIELRDSGNNLIASTVTFNAGNNTATITPTNMLDSCGTYTVTDKGGATDPPV